MTTINLTTIFTTAPLNNIAQTKHVNFKGNVIPTFPQQDGANKDSYISNPLLSRVLDIPNLEAAIKSPEVQAILRENNLPAKLNKKAITTIVPHLKNTRNIAVKIASNIKNSEINLKDLQEAALLHDIGKTLIPEKILEKKSSFNPDEKKIMNLHSELGYAILKQMNISQNALRLIKYHHQRPDGSGYPKCNNDFKFDINAQILEAADKYSALTEDRVYHKACSREEALSIIYEEVRKGVISEEVFEALKKSV